MRRLAPCVCLALCLTARALVALDLMPPAKAAQYKALLPTVWDEETSTILRSPETLWYDAESIVPSYQDSQGDPEGNRPNTIEPILIDLAVPGGHANLFGEKGKFNFPFKSGGADLSDNLVKINFWSVPRGANQSPLPVVYWKLNFSRWRWMFPAGTVIGEVLLLKFPDGDLRVFEIRTRKRETSGWRNAVFRPFLTATTLADAIKWARPQWSQSSKLSALVAHLLDDRSLTPRTLQSAHFGKAFETVSGYLDVLPDFGDPQLVKDLLKDTPYLSVGSVPWKSNGTQTTYAASTAASYSIVPRAYDGGMLPVDDVSCRRCHKDGGRQIGDFYDELVAYGELWGEDEIFSWHPFDTKSFVNNDGTVANFNNDNRRLRQDLVSAGLIVNYQPGTHPSSIYNELPRDWQYHPIAKRR